MKLVKAINSDKHAEDFGLMVDKSVYLYDQYIEAAWKGEVGDPLSTERLATSPVVRVNALWVEKNIKVSCNVADSMEKKITGLQGTYLLDPNKGLYFPYLPYSDINIHQGTVSYPLDLIFIKDDHVSKITENTRVGSTDTWSCPKCTGLLEVNGGFCSANNVKIGDRIAMFAVSESDLLEVEEEHRLIASGEYVPSTYAGCPNLVHLVSAIADSL